MLEIRKSINNRKAIVELEGRLDAASAPELQKELDEIYDSIDKLVFDFRDLKYISSTGIRILVVSTKKLGPNKVKVTHPNESVKEVFELTGLAGDIL